MTRLVALTGGTGFLGRHAIRAFHEAGWRVRILTRRAPNLPEIADIPVELIPGDLSDDAALSRLCGDVETIVHIAGVVKARDEAGFMRANADGAAAAAAAWRRAAPDARFTLVSSMAARAPHLSPYAASKRAGETRVAEIAGDGDWRVVRPAAVYGPYDQESLKVLKLAAGPVQIMLNAADARVAMIDVRDAAAALAALAAAPGGGAVHELTDARADGYRWGELIEIAATALGRRPRAIRLPTGALRAIGAVGDGVSALTGSTEMLTKAKAREILHPDWSADPALIPPANIWAPRIALPDGLAHMVAWARGTGAL